MTDSRYQLLKDFREEWPYERIQTMGLEEYTNRNKNSFCYWLEAKSDKLGSIWGGSSFKFGIYEKDQKHKTYNTRGHLSDDDYAWYAKYGRTREEAFAKVRSLLIEVLDVVYKKDYAAIDHIDLGATIKWKLAFIFSDFQILNVFSKRKLDEICKLLDLGWSKKDTFSTLQDRILRTKPLNQDYFIFGDQFWRNIQPSKELLQILEISKDNLLVYFDILDNLIEELDIQYDSEIAYFNYDSKKLIFGIGQRYIFNLSKKGFHFISQDPFSQQFEQFEGPLIAYFNQVSLFDNIDKAINAIIPAAADILNVTRKSGFLKNDKADFREMVFNKVFRNRVLAQLDDTKSSDSPINNDNMNHPLNQILYGPPGTGKTYRTINKALSIIENRSENDLESENREDLKRRFKGYLDNGQIVFTTFHQSMSYEDFVEGIKPEIDENEDGERKVIYDVKDGIFKSIVARAKELRVIDSAEEANKTFDDAWNDLIEKIEAKLEEEQPYTLPLLSPNKTIDVILISNNGNLKLKPKKGREKGYTVSYNRIKRLHEAYPDLQVVNNIDKQFRAVIGGMNSSAYWAVLNYINIWLKDNSIETSPVAREALPHVLIIDEINRGNVSAIFGELITLIEESKRTGREEELEVILPYSKQKFSVPSNLYLLGTMNTADRSVEALDTALRRRFAFEEMMPQPELLRRDGALKATNGVLSVKDGSEIDLVKILETINKRIVALLDKDHQIGHSYLINVQSVQDLIHAFNNCIIPLLKEYFYRDEEKIALVLGAGFFKIENEMLEENLFPDIDIIRKPESKPRVRILTLAEDQIIEALNQLIL